MCNHHHNLESEHMTFKVEQIAYVSEDTPELIGNQRLLSWCAKQEWGRRAARLLGKWWRWTTERDRSISNITSKKCNNTVVINCLVYISRGITMTTAWLYSIPKDTAYNVMCWKMQDRQDKAHCFKLPPYTCDTGMTNRKLKNIAMTWYFWRWDFSFY